MSGRVATGSRRVDPRCQEAAAPLVTRNSFADLKDECSEEISRSHVDTLLKERTTVFAGDSQVGYLGPFFSGKDKNSRTSVCFLWAGVKEIGYRISLFFSGENVSLVARFSVGRNDIGKVKSEELRRRFREALKHTWSLTVGCLTVLIVQLGLLMLQKFHARQRW